jgi:DNA-binding transcriptional MerR regulator
VEYRVEELAAECGISVDTVRYYQTKGLLPPPRRQGRIALYGNDHVRRLQRIREFQGQGLNLTVIRRLLEGRLSKADADLAAAVAAAEADGDDEFISIEELARRSDVPSALLRAVQRAGLVLGRIVDDQESFTAADVETVRLGLKILEFGMPLDALLELGRRYHDAAQQVAKEAVAIFDEHIRKPLRAEAKNEEEAAERQVAAFRELLPAITGLVAHHFRRLLLRSAMQYIEQVGDEAEITASREESKRMRERV